VCSTFRELPGARSTARRFSIDPSTGRAGSAIAASTSSIASRRFGLPTMPKVRWKSAFVASEAPRSATDARSAASEVRNRSERAATARASSEPEPVTVRRRASTSGPSSGRGTTTSETGAAVSGSGLRFTDARSVVTVSVYVPGDSRRCSARNTSTTSGSAPRTGIRRSPPNSMGPWSYQSASGSGAGGSTT
jgi:hypothetical protein